LAWGQNLKGSNNFPSESENCFLEITVEHESKKGAYEVDIIEADKSRYASIISTCPRPQFFKVWIACNCQVSRGPIPNRKSSSHGSRATLESVERDERLTRLRKWSRVESSGAWHRAIEACFGRGSMTATLQYIYLSSSIQASPYKIQVSIGSSDTMQTAGLF